MTHDRKKKEKSARERRNTRSQRKKNASRFQDQGHPHLSLQRKLGNQAVQELVKGRKQQEKLEVSSPNDEYEQEADRAAKKVTRKSGENLSISEIAGSTPNNRGHRIEQISPTITATTNKSVATAEAEREMNSSSSGRPLPEYVRAFFESRFGADFTGIRIHDDRNAAELNRMLNANAVTHGRDIYFGAGQYRPDKSAGKALLAHELTHVLQQTGNGQTYTVQLTDNPVIQRDDQRGTVETSKGVEEIEGTKIVSSAESLRERLDIHEEVINEYIRDWTEDAIGDVRDGIQDAAASFRIWYRNKPRKPNTAAFVIDVASAVTGVIGAAFPPAGLPSAIIGGLLTVSKDPISQGLDPNAEPDKMADQLQQNMINISSQIDQLFANFGERLKRESSSVWNNLGLALTMDPPLLSIAKEVLHTSAGVPRENEPYGAQLLSQMIYTYLDWEQRFELQESTFFISSESVEYSLFTEQVQQRLRRKAEEEARQRLGVAR